VPIGVIQRVQSAPGEVTKIAYAKPFTDFSSLDVVGVVVAAPKRDPRDAVLPPVPKPAPSPDRQQSDERTRQAERPWVEAEPRGRDSRERAPTLESPGEPADGTARRGGGTPAARPNAAQRATPTVRPNEAQRAPAVRPNEAQRATPADRTSQRTLPRRSPDAAPAYEPRRHDGRT
jgi:rod shape-determining protein MreC